MAISSSRRSTSSPWGTNVRMPRAPRLHRDLKCDVCIVGAGVAGLSVAYNLLVAGKKIVVVDDGKIGGGQTQVTTSHLVNVLDHRYEEIERVRGEEVARLAAESHTAAINKIGDTALAEGIACEFERLDGYLFLPPDGCEETLDREFEAARRTGIVRVEHVARAPLTSFDTGPCLRFQGQGQMHPLMYLAGLARAIMQRCGQIYNSTHADSIEGGSPAKVSTPEGTISCDAVVVATNVPVNDMLAIHTKQAPYMTYAIAARLPSDVADRALYWDTAIRSITCAFARFANGLATPRQIWSSWAGKITKPHRRKMEESGTRGSRCRRASGFPKSAKWNIGGPGR